MSAQAENPGIFTSTSRLHECEIVVNDGLPWRDSPDRLLSSLAMKTISSLCLLLFVMPLAAQNEDDNKPDLLPNQQAFLNLPEEKRVEFAKHLGEATRVFQQKRIFEALEELDKASAIFTDSPEIHNLRGSCYVEMRAFDKALAEFEKASALSKDNPSIIFNIGEV